MLKLAISLVLIASSCIELLIGSKANALPTNQFLKPHNLQMTPKEFQRFRAKGMEVVPNEKGLSTNEISKEPSCEELRAMWRYYKRQARAAELTNQIPLPELFGPENFRSRQRFGTKNGPYGKMVFRGEKNRRRRPMEEVIRMFGMPSKGSQNILKEPVMTYVSEPKPESSLDKIKEIFREERIKAKGGEERSDNKEFGKVVLAPPGGGDGRVANKPKELMTPFERIRFGHVDDLLTGSHDETEVNRRRAFFPLQKRRNGGIALPFIRAFDESRHLKSPLVNESIVLVSPIELREEILMDNSLDLDKTQLDNGRLQCTEIEGASCLVHSDCSCTGNRLFRCHVGICQTLFISNSGLNEREDEIWHAEPVPLSHLGVWEENLGEPLTIILDEDDKKKKRSVDNI